MSATLPRGAIIEGMIGKLTGIFAGTTPEGAAILDIQGVGYAVRVPASTLLDIKAKKEHAVSLFIHTAVREDAIDLYGFMHEEELEFFKELLNVSSIGPKTALGILNVADVSSLRRSIAGGDSTVLTKVYGIGKKSAERIVVELRDKIASGSELSDSGAALSDADVIEALVALGYSALESRKALKSVGSDVTGTRERLSAALRNLGSHTS